MLSALRGSPEKKSVSARYCRSQLTSNARLSRMIYVLEILQQVGDCFPLAIGKNRFVESILGPPWQRPTSANIRRWLAGVCYLCSMRKRCCPSSRPGPNRTGAAGVKIGTAVLFRLYLTVLAWHNCSVSCDRRPIRTGAWIVPRDESILGILMIECGAWMELVTDTIEGRLPRVNPNKNSKGLRLAAARRAIHEGEGAGRAHETELPS